MATFRGSIIFFITVLAFTLSSCSDTADRKQEPIFKQVPEIREIRPQSTVKIKLKRTSKDEYSWELNGNSVDEVIKADRALRKDLKVK